MDVKFYSGKISTNGGTFENFVAKLLKKDEVVKTASVKTAETKDEGKTSGQPQAEAKLTNCPKKEDGKGKGGKADNKPAESSGQPEAEAKLTNNPNVEGENKTAPKAETKTEKKDEKKASITPSFVKIAKLDAKTKAFLRDYWKTLYPADYVEAMLQEK